MSDSTNTTLGKRQKSPSGKKGPPRKKRASEEYVTTMLPTGPQPCGFRKGKCTNSTTFYCTECSLYLCEDCRTMHSDISVFKEHKIVDTTAITDKNQKICKNHGLSCTEYCTRCKVLLCKRCLSDKESKHSSHPIKSEEEHYEKYKLGLINSIQAPEIEKLKTLKKQVKKVKNELQKKQTEFKNTEKSYLVQQQSLKEKRQAY